jgi:EAL domain-containing protein (putative c-di-GMP-specific phosphodiesterase class I)
MDGDLKARKALETSLRNALARREFEVFYQPFADTKSERVRGYEALVRWRDPKLGPISSAEFVPLAEETGLIVPLGELICGRPARMRRTGRPISASASSTSRPRSARRRSSRRLSARSPRRDFPPNAGA